MTAVYAIRELGSPGRLNRRPIAEVMTIPAPTISDREPLAEALATMVRLGLHHAAAVDRHGKCVGVISDRAVVTRWATDRSPLLHQTVASALPAIPAIIGSNSVVLQAAHTMRRNGVDAVAVTDQLGRPIGIVTESDLIGLLTEGG